MFGLYILLKRCFASPHSLVPNVRVQNLFCWTQVNQTSLTNLITLLLRYRMYWMLMKTDVVKMSFFFFKCREHFWKNMIFGNFFKIAEIFWQHLYTLFFYTHAFTNTIACTCTFVKVFIEWVLVAIEAYLAMGRRPLLSANNRSQALGMLLDKLRLCLEWHKVPYKGCYNTSMPLIQ